MTASVDIRSRLLALEHFGIKLGLDQIRALLRLLSRPDLAVRTFAVAGTNGKGSVAAMLERGLREVGLRTGLYTSPHLIDLEERVAIDGRAVTADVLDNVAARVLEAGRALPFPPTFFEATTAMALDIFREARVDVAVLEVGLGGRLDATNAVASSAAAITAIDLDHQQHLGDTVEAIAREKAGIIKPGSVVVLAPNPQVVEHEVAAACASAGARLIRARDGVRMDVRMHDGRATMELATPDHRYGTLRLALRGRHQVDNALTAIRLLEAVSHRDGLGLGPAAIRAAVEDVTWPGRLELFRMSGYDVLIDGAHNPAGARALAAYVGDTYGRRVPMVVAMMRDKQAGAMLRALATVTSEFICTAPHSPRACTPGELLALAATVVPSIESVAVDGPLSAVAHAATLGSPVVVSGSLYLAGEVRRGLLS